MNSGTGANFSIPVDDKINEFKLNIMLNEVCHFPRISDGQFFYIITDYIILLYLSQLFPVFHLGYVLTLGIVPQVSLLNLKQLNGSPFKSKLLLFPESLRPTARYFTGQMRTNLSVDVCFLNIAAFIYS